VGKKLWSKFTYCTVFEDIKKELLTMGKIFSIEIEYDIYKHLAVVSVLDHEDNRFFHIQLMDPFLKEIFQIEHIRYKGMDGYRYCDLYNNDLSVVLLDRMVNAIQQKLSGKTAIIRSLFWKRANH
jgi:hypothetical protein